MKRTQIQLPEHLYAAASAVADRKEISMAELVRRGLEYMVAVSPSPENTTTTKWELPKPHDLGSNDPFLNENWRADLHMRSFRVAEENETYGEKE